MNGFLFEVLLKCGWRRRNDIFWLLADARKEANRLVKLNQAKAIRIFAIKVKLKPIEEIEIPEMVKAKEIKNSAKKMARKVIRK